MFLFLIVILFIVAIYYIVSNKIRIKFRTFKEKGFKPIRGKFGVYCYCGKQGKGKTYSVVEYLIDHDKEIKSFSNVKDIKNVTDITYFTGFKGLISIKEKIDSGEISTDKQIVIVYDEIFTELQKKSQISKEVLDFLCQMRKRKIIFLTTAQEWAEIPLTFRRFCRYQIDCNMINIFITGLLIKTFKDAENMKWSDEEQEHVAPIIETSVSHTRKHIANSYDTFLRISSVDPQDVDSTKK